MKLVPGDLLEPNQGGLWLYRDAWPDTRGGVLVFPGELLLVVAVKAWVLVIASPSGRFGWISNVTAAGEGYWHVAAGEMVS